jgi:hypothetical protein
VSYKSFFSSVAIGFAGCGECRGIWEYDGVFLILGDFGSGAVWSTETSSEISPAAGGIEKLPESGNTSMKLIVRSMERRQSSMTVCFQDRSI